VRPPSKTDFVDGLGKLYNLVVHRLLYSHIYPRQRGFGGGLKAKKIRPVGKIRRGIAGGLLGQIGQVCHSDVDYVAPSHDRDLERPEGRGDLLPATGHLLVMAGRALQLRVVHRCLWVFQGTLPAQPGLLTPRAHLLPRSVSKAGRDGRRTHLEHGLPYI